MMQVELSKGLYFSYARLQLEGHQAEGEEPGHVLRLHLIIIIIYYYYCLSIGIGIEGQLQSSEGYKSVILGGTVYVMLFTSYFIH